MFAGELCLGDCRSLAGDKTLPQPSAKVQREKVYPVRQLSFIGLWIETDSLVQHVSCEDVWCTVDISTCLHVQLKITSVVCLKYHLRHHQPVLQVEVK